VPELPEAETIVRGLRPAVVGRVVEHTRVPKPDILRESRGRFARKVRGRRIVGVDRRGKNVLLRLDEGSVVAVNLGMTGRLLPFDSAPRGVDRPGHPAVHLLFDGGGVLVFDDTRRFGTVECLSAAEWSARSARMGPEPLDERYTARELRDGLSRSRAPVRSWLLDQRRIAGVGNIYANEALFLSGVHPRRRARDLTGAEATRLHRSIRRVLREAIHAGGTTIRDYRDASGAEGRYARRLLVYARDGEACSRCGAVIERVVFGNRSAFFCPGCQPTTNRGASS
jgi:formamidopyrimidine-DNA glycosylase